MSPENIKAPLAVTGEAQKSATDQESQQHDDSTAALALQVALSALPHVRLTESRVAWMTVIAHRDELRGVKRGRHPKNSPPVGNLRSHLAERYNLSETILDEAARVDTELAMDDPIRENILLGKAIVGNVYDKITRGEKHAETLAKVEGLKAKGKYQIIVADPAWEYKDDGVGRTGAAANHYPTSNDAILKLSDDVKAIATDDAMLLLWAVSPLLPFALEVVKAWGFEYHSHAVWHKTGRMGMGSILRIDTELLLVTKRGNGIPIADHGVRNFIAAPASEHSKKPVEVYEALERLWPNASKIELFARNNRDGWESWGTESPEVPT